MNKADLKNLENSYAMQIMPSFPTYRELIDWFDRTNCDFSSDRNLQPCDAKKAWLRNVANEEWYATRLGYAINVFKMLSERHEEVVEANLRSHAAAVNSMRSAYEDSLVQMRCAIDAERKEKAMLQEKVEALEKEIVRIESTPMPACKR
jgi:hypothetical protein